MKQVIKNSFLWAVVFSLTVIVIWITYAAVTTVNTWDTLTAEMWNNLMWNYDYSTTEVNTWKKWIDGRPIYRKVFDFWTWLPANAIHSLPLNIANYDRPISISYSHKNSSWNWITEATSMLKSSTEIRYWYTDDTNVYIRTYDLNWAYSAILVLEYIKD